MGGAEDYVEDEILEAGKAVRELLRQKLYPGFVTDKDTVAFTTPWSNEEDYRVGIFLYDIQDYSAMAAGYTFTGSGKKGGKQVKHFPPKAVELSYMIFCNENKKFGGIDREAIQSTLNEIIRVVYDNPVLEPPAVQEAERMQEPAEEKPALQISFAYLDLELKIKLWGSFHKAIQPAVYLKAVPVLISSTRAETVYPVSERDYGVRRKHGEENQKGGL